MFRGGFFSGWGGLISGGGLSSGGGKFTAGQRNLFSGAPGARKSPPPEESSASWKKAPLKTSRCTPPVFCHFLIADQVSFIEFLCLRHSLSSKRSDEK